MSHANTGTRLAQLPVSIISRHVPPACCVAASSGASISAGTSSAPSVSCATTADTDAGAGSPSSSALIWSESKRPTFSSTNTFGWSYTVKLSSAYPSRSVKGKSACSRDAGGSDRLARPKVSSTRPTPSRLG